jgi:ABC-type dipeptide/oligopeptide/nickel transport system ATPase component
VERAAAGRLFAAPAEPYTRALLAAALELEAVAPSAGPLPRDAATHEPR